MSPRPKSGGARPAAAGWVYKSDETAVARHQSPVARHQSAVTRPEPVVESVVKSERSSSRAIDRAVLPLTLLMMTALAPVSWLRGKR